MPFQLIVEDGSGVPNANSYVSADEVDTFLDLEGITIPSTKDRYYLAYKAALKLDNQYTWLGRKTIYSQPMQWPRTGFGVCRIELDDHMVPDNVKKAQLYLIADILLNAPEAGVSSNQALRRKKVGNLEIEYFDSKGVNSGTSWNEWTDGVIAFLRGLISFGLVTKRV